MAVTQLGIKAPDLPDPFNPVGDMNTLASTADAAIRQSASKGTASQRTAFTSTATNGTLWQDTDGIKMLWRKDGASWVPAISSASGTVAQMNSFTQAPTGFIWTLSTGTTQLIRTGGAWRPISLSGSVAKADVVSTGSLTTPITFQFPFSSPPVITVALWGNVRDCQVFVDAVTPAGFTLGRGSNSVVTRNIGAFWTASIAG